MMLQKHILLLACTIPSNAKQARRRKKCSRGSLCAQIANGDTIVSTKRRRLSSNGTSIKCESPFEQTLSLRRLARQRRRLVFDADAWNAQQLALAKASEEAAAAEEVVVPEYNLVSYTDDGYYNHAELGADVLDLLTYETGFVEDVKKGQTHFVGHWQGLVGENYIAPQDQVWPSEETTDVDDPTIEGTIINEDTLDEIQENTENIEALSSLILDADTQAELEDGETLSTYLIQKFEEGDTLIESKLNSLDVKISLPEGESSITEYLTKLVNGNTTLIDDRAETLQANIDALSNLILDDATKAALTNGEGESLSTYLLQKIQEGDASLESKLNSLDAKISLPEGESSITEYLTKLVNGNTTLIDNKAKTLQANIDALSSFILDGVDIPEGESLSTYLLQRIQEGDASLESKISLPAGYSSITEYLTKLVGDNTTLIDKKAKTLQDNIDALTNLILDDATKAEISEGETLSTYLLKKIQEGDDLLEGKISLPEGESSITEYLERLVGDNKTLIDDNAMKIQTNADNIDALTNLILDDATKAEIPEGETLSTYLLKKIQAGDDLLDVKISLPEGESSITEYLERLVENNKTLIDEEVLRIEGAMELLGNSMKEADLELAQALTDGDIAVIEAFQAGDAQLAEALAAGDAKVTAAFQAGDMELLAAMDAGDAKLDGEINVLVDDIGDMDADIQDQFGDLENELAQLKSDIIAKQDAFNMQQVHIDLDVGASKGQDDYLQLMDMFLGLDWWQYLIIGVGIALVSATGCLFKSRERESPLQDHIPLYM